MSAGGVDYDLGSIYAQLEKLSDPRKARGKRYSLEIIMMIVILTKNNLDELVELLGLSRRIMPHDNTYRRILANGIYLEEIERLVGEFNRQGVHGRVYAVDGKAVRGMKDKEEGYHEYLLSVYDVEKAMELVSICLAFIPFLLI